MKFSREWAMPSSDTLSIVPIARFVERYIGKSVTSVDPFARDCTVAKYRNDLDPATKAEYHMDACDFLLMLNGKGVKSDLVIFDPPYSPRQISECYKGMGLEVGMKDTQSASLYHRVKGAIANMVAPNGVVLSFGWNSVGMGLSNGFTQEEILLVCHGGAHNDTICVAERLTQPRLL